MANRFINYGVGLDMSKDHIHVCFGGYTSEQEFKIIGQKKFENSKSGHKALSCWITKHRKDKEIPLRVLLEVTGVYHEQALYYLFHEGFQVSLELSKRVKRYLESIGHKSKNDKLDGQGIARMICERKIDLWEPIAKDILSIRTLLRHRKAMLSNKVQFMNQLHAINHQAFVQRKVTKSLDRLIKQIDKEIELLEKNVETMVQADPEFNRKVLDIAQSVKGLGFISVLTVIAETNGLKNFTSARQLVSYAGYDVIENSSGKFNGKTRISKQGNAHLRSNLYMPALSAIRCKSEPFYSLYMRILMRNGGIKKKASVAVQRKLLVLIYTLWKKDELFNITYYQEKSSTDETPVLHRIDHSKKESLPSAHKSTKNDNICLV